MSLSVSHARPFLSHRRRPVPICGRPPSRKDLAARLVWSNAVICPAFVVRSYDRWPRWGTRIGSQTWAAMSELRWAPRVVPILGSTDHHLAVAVLSSAKCVVRAVIRARRSPPRSVAAVTTRQIDRPQFLEIEFADRFELVGEPRSFEIGRQVVEPTAVLLLHCDERRHRRRPPFCSRQGSRRMLPAGSLAWRRRGWRRQGLVLLAPLRSMSHLPFGGAHRFGADALAGHACLDCDS